MTTLYLKSKDDLTFESLGSFDGHSYKESDLFPKNTIIKLTSGKFPLDDYKDLYTTYVFNNTPVKLIGFCYSACNKTFGKYGTPMITVEKK